LAEDNLLSSTLLHGDVHDGGGEAFVAGEGDGDGNVDRDAADDAIRGRTDVDGSRCGDGRSRDGEERDGETERCDKTRGPANLHSK
jgi:hypothetical protein